MLSAGTESSQQQTRRWLLFIYRVPQDPPGRRTYIWRQLRGLGALYLQQAAAILPAHPAMREALALLAARVKEYGGEVSLLETCSPDAEWDREIVARFNAARDEEYAELVEGVERFEDEIARETRKRKFTFAELEDIEADWEKLERWRKRVEARDFFGATGTGELAVAVARGRAALDAFTAAVMDHEGVDGGARDD